MDRKIALRIAAGVWGYPEDDLKDRDDLIDMIIALATAPINETSIQILDKLEYKE